jgi:2-dehydro-3-deoxygluconokinase
LCATTSTNFAANIQQFFELCEDTATFLHEKQKKMQFYFVIREIMVIFALEIERQLIIELHFLTETWNFNLLLITNKIKTKKLKLSNMAKIVTLGEIMLRLSPEGNDRFIQSESLRIIPGGGEANVAVSLANYGHDAYFVSKLPKHEIGQIAVNGLRRYGVNTEFIARGGDRVGLYYAETGASMRPSKVIYDRAHSAIAEADPSDFDFDKIMEGAQWFHWSGITPAISDKAAELTKLACEAAKRHGVTVSVDLNFRKKLWTSEKAISVMRPLMKYVDVCIGNEEDAQLCLGFKPDADVEGGKTDAEGYYGIFKGMMEEFGFKYVVSTLRESLSATHNGWKALIYDGKEFYQSKHYDINPIIDRVGGGDSFSGGLIHGLLTKETQAEALEFAVAASALKHTIPGDFNLVSADEVESLAGGNANGRVQR